MGRSSLLKKDNRRTTKPELLTLPSLRASLTLKIMPGRRRSKLLMAGPREKMMHAKPKLPTLITLLSLKMTEEKLILLLSMQELMLKLLLEIQRIRLSVKESARRFLTVKQPLQVYKKEQTHKTMIESMILMT